MNIKSIIDQFDFHVDASHYGYQWTEDMYITVDYSAIKEGEQVVASVNKISATPWLMGSIAMRGNWMAVDKEIIAAAQDHAEKEFNKQSAADIASTMLAGVHPTMASVIAPFIKY